jgi:hypothetical protein
MNDNYHGDELDLELENEEIQDSLYDYQSDNWEEYNLYEE